MIAVNKYLFSGSISAAAFAASLIAAAPLRAGENVVLHEHDLGEWTALWWQWQEEYFSGFDFGGGVVDCSIGQSGPVYFLGGTSGGAAMRVCDASIKGHKHLMAPLVNASVYNAGGEPDSFCLAAGFEECTVSEKQIVLDGIFSEDPPGIFNSTACLLHVEIDGQVGLPWATVVRTQTPPFNYSGDPQAVADGYWVVFSPLPKGTHEIRFAGGICDLDSGDAFFQTEVTYTVTVGAGT